MSSRSNHVVESTRIFFFFFLWLYNITVCLHHSFFVHLSIDRHLDCFHILPTLDNAAVNMEEQKSFWYPIFISFGYIPRSKMAGSCARSYAGSVLFLITWGNFKLFPIVAEVVYIPTSSAQGIPSHHILANICCFLSSWW